MAKTHKLKSSARTTGSVETGFPTTIDQLLKIDTGAKYGTLDSVKYQTYLDSLTLAELQEEGSKHGLFMIDDKERLKRSLMSEFRIYASSYVTKPQPKQTDVRDVPKVIKDLMAEGR